METFASIKNKYGLHTRAAAKLVECANQFSSRITLSYRGKTSDAKSMLDILTLAVVFGETIQINAEGADATDACNALQTLIEEGFGEE